MTRKKRTAVKQQKADILNYFRQNTDRPLTLNDIYNHFQIYDNDEKTFARLLVEELVEEGKLTQTGRSRFTAATGSSNVVEGRLDFVNPRFGFVHYDDAKSDVYIEADYMNGALDGDLVKVQITKPDSSRKSGNPEGRVIEVIERGRTNFVGKVRTFGNYALVKPDNKGMHDSLFVAKQHIHGAETNDLVIVKMLTYPTNLHQGTAEVIEILGKSGDNNAEMNAIMAEFDLPVHFPADVAAEAEAISEVISPEEIARRRDVRNILTFTIDPEDAKDFDDALSFRVLENGNYEVGVHIADVTYYVRPGTKLEAEASERATSVYLVDRTIPMLPEKLSNNLCSLRPNEDKLVFSSIFELTPQAAVVKEWFGRCIMHSDRRFAYEQAQALLDSEDVSEADMPYYDALKVLNTLAKTLKKQRYDNGAINFETTEVKFQLDAEGRPVGVYQKIRKDSHKLIEEFMLLANKQVATYVFNYKSPAEKKKKKATNENGDPTTNTMVYRIHEPPNQEKLDTFAKFASRMGYQINTYNQKTLSKSLNEMTENASDPAIQNVLGQLAVRTMSKARYSTLPLGHFGLAFDHYSHFTSPIRRYPDMMAHRLLQNYLDNLPSPPVDSYEEQCKHSSDREKMASDAERASIKYKQVEYISLQDKRLIYDGVITGLTDFGIFVEIGNTGSEGMVSLRDLHDDYYEYDADNYRLIGQRSKRIINFGDAVKVSVKSTDLENRSIDLNLEAVGDTKFDNKSSVGGRGEKSSGSRRAATRSPKTRKNNPQPKSKGRKKR